MSMREWAAWAFGLGWFGNAFLFVPQILAVWRRKSAEGISLLTFGGFTLMQIVAVIHGLQVQDKPLWMGWGSSLVSCGTLTAMTICYRFRKQ